MMSKRLFPLFLAMLLASGPAQALEPGLSGSLGAEAVVNDPFVNRFGSCVSMRYHLWPWLALGIHQGWYPDLGQTDWNSLTSTLVSQVHIAPDVSRIRQRVGFTTWAYPIRAPLGSLERWVGGYVGMGLVHTLDDLELLQAEGNPEFEATADQWHPSTILGLSGELWGDFVGLRFRIERETYFEVVGMNTSETKKNNWVGLEVVWRASLSEP